MDMFDNDKLVGASALDSPFLHIIRGIVMPF